MHAQRITSVHAARPAVTGASPCPAGAHKRVHPTSTSTHKPPARPGFPLPLCRRARAPGARLRVRGAGCGTQNAKCETHSHYTRVALPLIPRLSVKHGVPQCVDLGCAHLVLSKLRQRWRRRPWQLRWRPGPRRGCGGCRRRRGLQAAAEEAQAPAVLADVLQSQGRGFLCKRSYDVRGGTASTAEGPHWPAQAEEGQGLVSHWKMGL